MTREISKGLSKAAPLPNKPKPGPSHPIGEEERDPLAETGSIVAEMEAALTDIAKETPRIAQESVESKASSADLEKLLETSLAINMTMGLEDTLRIVMKNAIELLGAERGFIMLTDDSGQLEYKTAYNLQSSELESEIFQISNSIANNVAESGKSVFASDAMADKRYADQASIQELHLRSIMCVPLKLKQNVIGVIYLDNSKQAKHFLRSDLYIFQVLAGLAASAVHNATLYEHLLDLKLFTEKVINKSPVGILVIDSNYQIVSINDAFAEILDKNKDEISLLTEAAEPTKFFDLIQESEILKWRQMIDIAFTTKEPYENSRYFHNTGYIEKALSVKLSPISKLPLGGDGIIIAMEDITEKVVMEKYVILSEKLVARGEMAASIGHELNNYLAIIGNNAELLNRNLDSKKFDKVAFNSRQICDSVQKMKRFTDGLMDFSKLDSEFISYDLKHLIEDLIFSLKVQPRFNNVLFTVSIQSNIPNLKMDVGQIQQVFLNLLNNAADAFDEKEAQLNESEPGEKHGLERRIRISAELNEEDETVIIEIADNGVGMTEETLAKLFNTHFTTKEKGHGLGLANCKKIAERHGGRLLATSIFGEGSVFRMTIPLNRAEENPTE